MSSFRLRPKIMTKPLLHSSNYICNFIFNTQHPTEVENWATKDVKNLERN